MLFVRIVFFYWKATWTKNVLESLKWVIRGQKSPQASVGLKSVSKCACTWTAACKQQRGLWISLRMLTNFTFSEHGMPGNTGFFAEPDGDVPDEVKNFLYGKIPMKKCCGSQPRQGTFSGMLSFRVGRMWMEASSVTWVSEGNSQVGEITWPCHVTGVPTPPFSSNQALNSYAIFQGVGKAHFTKN